MDKPAVQLQRVANFRDVGQTVNAFLGQKSVTISPTTNYSPMEAAQHVKLSLRVREGFIFRSARPDDASAKDKLNIRHEFGIKTILDLRTNKVIFLFILGYRIEAVRLITTEVMLQRGLLGLGTDTIDHSGSEICQALGLYTSLTTLPVLVHCTQGKDRTGLICVLILMILRVPLAAIEHDYFLTDPALEAERHERLAEIRQIGLTDEWAITAPELVTGVQRHLDVMYGGLEAYLDDIGFDQNQRARLRELLLY
ncbi:Protein-tyrosine phosphatase, SIW14-like protein [Metarhizium album ARSEF 1941]|uniref:Protein-tyrosine phosphatase, SIW14-like protein n=1 Tax=Metarhizium album (strain ARSEF 1941) TaxID=1081103 RepID=A0A0B2WP02_METAS|nr:Protein-tyrosine phosphatase, SIW14-like protein [Metarhizium album ARSEF 1941]KHN95394.1 Protein-tyrosine phosphatase, SIW14-like protein [Metarhizium album ARSEF 1941]